MTTQNFLPLNGIDFIEFYVGNAKQAALFYEACFGFEMRAYAGPETGVKDRASYFVQQGNVRLVFTGAVQQASPVAEHVFKHGDGVKVVAIAVEDAPEAFRQTTGRGAQPASEPVVLQDEYGSVKLASIYTYGETIHTFVERKDYNGTFLPGYIAKATTLSTPSLGFKHIDHCVGNVGWGEMDRWVKFYEEVMGLKLMITFDDQDISTEYTALMSKVMANGNGAIKFPINEPAKGKKKSQVEEYIDIYQGAGVQHIAIAVEDIIFAVSALKSRGIEFLQVPEHYYSDLQERVGVIEEPIKILKDLNILVDRDEEGYLLQVFTKPISDRPTIFFEIMQRKGAKSFGKGNFKALFEAMEREQALRGTL